jgi:hypothetical protein
VITQLSDIVYRIHSYPKAKTKVMPLYWRRFYGLIGTSRLEDEVVPHETGDEDHFHAPLL